MHTRARRHVLAFIHFLNETVHLFLLQKTNDNQEQVIKKRKKKELSNIEQKTPKKNRGPKQG